MKLLLLVIHGGFNITVITVKDPENSVELDTYITLFRDCYGELAVKKSFWKASWFPGLLISIVILFTAGTDVMQNLEHQAYDLGLKLMPARTASNQLVVIGIDAKSISKFGNWPWPRSIVADLIKKVGDHNPKAIGVAIDLSEPQNTLGLKYIKRFKKIYADVDEEALDSGFSSEYVNLLQEAEYGLNTDRLLASALRKTRNVVLAVPYNLRGVSVDDFTLPKYFTKNTLAKQSFPNVAGNQYLPDLVQSITIPLAATINLPLQRFGKVVKTIGHAQMNAYSDQVVRSENLILEYNNNLFPSFTLMLAALGSDLSLNDIHIQKGLGLKLGDKKIDTDKRLDFFPTFYEGQDGAPAFEVVSFYDVYKGRVSAEMFNGKIVLVGQTEGNGAVPFSTPNGVVMAPISFMAISVSSIMKGDFIRQPSWAAWLEVLAIFIIASFMMSVLSRVKLVIGISISVVLIIILFNTEIMLLITQGVWVKLMAPTLQLIIGLVLIATIRLFDESIAGWKIETADSNRMLGMTLQSQGQLDMAFEKFRNLPVDDTAMDLFYNLGLDYERKRLFAKAGSVFRYIVEYDADFRDVKKRILSNREMEGRLNPAVGQSAGAGTIVLDNASIQKPQIGRYDIIKEIGRGAMGMVYLGEDPKISRTVAIKTMSFAQEFEEDKLADIKSRFFREAKTAGRLNHPNIVTIYDVGEEDDLAYIAMDFLQGVDMSVYTKQENLLPIDEVFYVIKKVAEALDFGHSQSVVHRDIKPANVMYDRSKKNVKVTDFGVACLTDASKTKTGTILGTPSYMSPEQLAGKKVDGRSDIFSLGVMLFQLVTGELPFIGESMASLMYKISNEKHPDVRMFRPELSSCIVKVVDLALAKDTDKRFQTGEQMIRTMNKCQEHIRKRSVKPGL